MSGSGQGGNEQWLVIAAMVQLSQSRLKEEISSQLLICGADLISEIPQAHRHRESKLRVRAKLEVEAARLLGLRVRARRK